MGGCREMPPAAWAPKQPATAPSAPGSEVADRGRPRRSRTPLYLALALALLTVVVWRGTLDNGFVNYDDPDYVTENPHVQAGLTLAGLRWASHVVIFNWQ